MIFAILREMLKKRYLPISARFFNSEKGLIFSEECEINPQKNCRKIAVIFREIQEILDQINPKKIAEILQ